MDPEFEKWRKLTDEYAKELWAMQRGDFHARARVQRLAGEVVRLSSRPSDVSVSVDLKGHIGPLGGGQHHLPMPR